MKRITFFEFDKPCEKWTHSFIKKSMWAIGADWEHNDLFQECYVRYLMVVQKYEIKNQRHGMSLYMTACHNRFCDLRKARPKQELFLMDFVRWEAGSFSQDPYDHLEEVEISEELSPPLARLFDRANWDYIKPLCRRCKIRKDETRETTNQMMCRLAGVDDKRFDLRGELNQIVNI